MAKRTAQKRKTVGFAAANEQTPNSESFREQGALEISRVIIVDFTREHCDNRAHLRPAFA
jgi:hypothetical protein